MLWAITSYFNPCHFQNRLATYRQFREHLNVPLIAVELGFDGRFDLTPADADRLIRVRDGDVMFQKERLFNIALRHLPDECTAVAWFDCDVILSDPHWGRLALQRLETADVIQPFGTVYRLQRDSPVDFARARKEIAPMGSLVKHWVEGKVDVDLWATADSAGLNFRGGLGWAARRELFEHIEFYDCCIIGGGDKPFCSELLGVTDRIMGFQQMSLSYQAHLQAWRSRFQRILPLRLDALDVELMQLWHGEYADRQYKQRHIGLGSFGYNPERDLRPGTDGAWKWTNPDSEMAAYVQSYFHSRREDG